MPNSTFNARIYKGDSLAPSISHFNHSWPELMEHLAVYQSSVKNPVTRVEIERDGSELCKLREFVESIARMDKEGETRADGSVYEPTGNDDEIDALYATIRRARALTGVNNHHD